MENDDIDDWLDLLDLDAIADPGDKVSECQYFLMLAFKEKDKDAFRWLVSGFFGAAYSYFEIRALQAYHGFHNPKTGEPIENEEALNILRKYVRVRQGAKRPTYVKTSGQHEITNELYEIRKKNTHHYPLSIMTTGTEIPECFHFGSMSGKGVPALAFCRKVMNLIIEVDRELQNVI